MTSPLRRRTALAAVATLGIGAILAATASATWATDAPTPGPTVVVQGGTVTVTRDAAHVQARCARIPGLQKHIAAVIDRIQGAPDVPGSVASLRAHADAARAAGRDDAARRLDDRAALRADRVTHLQHVSDRLTRVEQTVCAPLAARPATSS